VARNPYRRPDALSREARARGFPARSVFKLEEIDRRVRLLRPGQRVLDLGAAPGSWSLYASRRVGAAGRVLAVDLQPITQAFAPNVAVLCADVLSPDSGALAAPAPYDVVLSDMAPSTSGQPEADHARSCELFEAALGLALELGGPGSAFVGKLFMGEGFERLREAVRRGYAEARVIRPEATRRRSVEVFLVGLGKRG
jgi:23S rRNA (uridine2552-2'-O)-methyltransferase